MHYVERTAAKQDKLLLGGKLFVIFRLFEALYI